MATHRSLLIALSLACTAALGQASPKCQVQPKTLAAMHNCYRPLLVFSPAPNDPRLKRQGQILDADADDMMDRFVLFTPILPSAKGFDAPLDTPYVVLSAQQMQAIRAQFHIPNENFTVLLLGEDGSEQLRSTQPIGSARLNSLIDTMPSRKIEMKRLHAN
ncbi:MAG TPA: DUF4174 domain-containing protein [Silvibacterium sp.]|nr:DUF4174 domain-containing protein [Silvibacterium sp.]